MGGLRVDVRFEWGRGVSACASSDTVGCFGANILCARARAFDSGLSSCAYCVHTRTALRRSKGPWQLHVPTLVL